MSAEKFINSRVGGYVALGCLGAAVVWYIAKKIPSVQSAVNAVSPLNNDNVFKNSVDAIGQGVTGDGAWSLGSKVYDWTHTEYDPNVEGSGGFDWSSLNYIINPAAWAGSKVAEKFSDYDLPDFSFVDYVNPASNKNVINQGVEKLGQTVSGDSAWTLGGWIYDVFHPESKPKTTVKADSDWLNWNFNNDESINE